MNVQANSRTRLGRLIVGGGALAAVVCAGLAAPAQEVDKKVLESEARRAAVIAKVRPSVVAVFSPGGQGGGSGVLISDDGYALTNFHVVAGMMGLPAPIMQCGLPDGGYYHAVVVGLDKVGDVALIKLLPNKQGQKFPFSPLGDSDKVKEGDWSLAMGNPFLLATDFNPTVTFGLISGVHRYQEPAGIFLEYTDCIQIDTSINPGNSGGPLYNMDGELIGINGRGSFDKRSRINSGVGYAISINQIKNFMGHLRAGIDTDHATLGAEVKSEKEEGDLGRIVVTNVLEDSSDVARRGLKVDDQLWKFGFDRRLVTSVNQYKNVLGIFPKGWRVPLVYRRDNQETEILVRLMKLQKEAMQMRPQPRRRPGPQPARPGPAFKPSPAAKLFKAKKGYANYYFNELERDRLLAAFKKHGDFSTLTGPWAIKADVRLGESKTDEPANFQITTAKSKTEAELKLANSQYKLDPLKVDQAAADLKEPTDSGGLLAGIYLYHRLLTQGAKGFERQFDHGGVEPLYPPPPDGSKPTSWADRRVDCEVLLAEHAAFQVKYYFSLKDQTLLGMEVRTAENEDPCEIYFSDYKQQNGGRLLPTRMDVRYGNDHYGTFTMKQYQLAAK